MSDYSPSTLSQPFDIQIDVKVPMSDGVRLSADIYRPTSPGPFPTLLLRTIYDNQRGLNMDWARRFVQGGYAVVMQDVRGRFDSEGAWEPYIHEARDGYETQQWIGAQPWCDGNIGTFGVSYLGFTQTQPATLRSPYLKALVPIGSQQDNFGCQYADGAVQLHIVMFWLQIAGRTMQAQSRTLMDQDELYRRLPLISALDENVDMPYYRDIIRHYTYDDFWSSYSLRDRYGEVEAPAYFITGWYDTLMHDTFRLFQGWRSQARSREARTLTRLLVGPWSHQNIGSSVPYGPIAFGGAAELDLAEEQLRWFDRRLRGADNGMDDEPPVRIFVMGANEWRSENEWPLARSQYMDYHLHSGGDANSLHGSGALSTTPPDDEPPDRYRYDPEDPVLTVGGQIMFLTDSGPSDRRGVEQRDDVLVYTTEPLGEDIEVTGPVSLTLYASTSGRDTDFTGTLVDVYPDGKAIIICEGLLRARFRESLESPTLLQPGEVYELRVDMWETSNVFKAGHRIRLEVSSSNFPRFDRNLNTGNRPGMDAELKVADQTIYHDARRPSHLTLPVIPR